MHCVREVVARQHSGELRLDLGRQVQHHGHELQGWGLMNRE